MSVHIGEILDSKGLAGLDPIERERVEVHAAECRECADALIASRFAVSMLSTRAEVAKVEPSPFFASKVMNAIRDRRTDRLSIWSFRRWWQASYGMVGAMVLVAAIFGILTVLAPADEVQAEASGYSLYSTESDVLSRRPGREMTREQMLEVIYSQRKEQVNRR